MLMALNAVSTTETAERNMKMSIWSLKIKHAAEAVLGHWIISLIFKKLAIVQLP
jgi:hypothetical protein